MAENAIRPPKQIGLNELNKEGWESWLESFEWYEIATQLSSKAPEVQVAIFMAAMGREAQNIFKSFNLNNADKNNLSIVKDKFNNYFSPKLNTTIERFKFNQMKQKEDESFNDFLTRIKLQIANCKYAVMSDELLRDRIVVGIINNEIRERLLSEADLNLEKATQICIACENATNQMKHVLSDSDKQVAVTKMNIRQIVGSPEPEMNQEFVIQSVENTNLTEDWYEEVKIKYKKGKELLTADLLSRDCSYEDTYLKENFEVMMTTRTNKSSYEELQALTKEDQELQELKNLILYGWPNYKSAVPESCKKYWPYRDELSTNEDLIFKGSRVFIPLRWKAKILKLIHEGHQGTNSCLRRARDSIYWHGMSQDIINTVENCRTCQANQRNKTKEPMIIKEIPSLPWEIVAADIFSIKGKNYLLITDNYSGFIDFKEMKTLNSAETIEFLKKWFNVHGIPRLLETDNGPNFTSRDFKDFQKKWLFDHQTSSPLYPKSNGLAERAVQTAKNLIRKCLDSGQEVELALLNFYNTPRDGLPSPAQCLFSRRTRTLLPTSTHLLEPEIQKGHTQNLRNKREKQKKHHDKTVKTTQSFKEGEKIMLKQHHREWIPARVTQEVAPRSYKVQTPTGEYRRNSSFMRHTNLESPKQQRRRIPEIPKSTLPEGPGQSGDKEQAQVPEELNTSPRPFTGQEPRSDHQNAEHKNGTLPITTRERWGSDNPGHGALQQHPASSSTHPSSYIGNSTTMAQSTGSLVLYFRDDKVIGFGLHSGEEIIDIPEEYQSPECHERTFRYGKKPMAFYLKKDSNRFVGVPTGLIQWYANGEFDKIKLIKQDMQEEETDLADSTMESILRTMANQQRLMTDFLLTNKSEIRVDRPVKMDVATFDGRNVDPKIWIKIYENICENNGWARDKARINGMRSYLTGSALLWFDNKYQDKEEYCWKDWKQEFIGSFNENPIVSYDRAFNWRYRGGSLVEYFYQKQGKMRLGMPGLSEELLIIGIIHGLPQHMQEQLATANIKCKQSLLKLLENIRPSARTPGTVKKPVHFTGNSDTRLYQAENDGNVRAYLDSGSSLNLIHENLTQKNKWKTYPTKTLINTINHNKFTATEAIDLVLEAGEQTIKIQAIVLPDMPFDLLIGKPTLKSLKVKWDFFTDQISFFSETGPNLVTRRDVEVKYPSLCKRTSPIISKFEVDFGLQENFRVVSAKPYRLENTKRNWLNVKIRSMLSEGIIRPSNSAFASPCIVIPKKNGDYRLCVDYRRINDETLLDPFPFPRIDDIINVFGGCRFFSKLDLKDGFWQLGVSENTRKYTAFVTPSGHYEFLKLPFGWKNSPAKFQRIMTTILGDLLGDKVVAYIDDICCGGYTQEDCSILTHRILERLTTAGLVLNLDKCQFCVPRIDLLGRVIDGDTKKIRAEVTEKVRNMKRPYNLRSLQCFTGLTNHFRAFIKDYAHIVRPLDKLKGKDVTFEWDSECETAYQKLIALITEEPILRVPDGRLPFELSTDASYYGTGAILYQRDLQEKRCKQLRHKALELEYDEQRKSYLVTPEQVSSILGLYHDDPKSGGHSGFWRTYYTIKNRFWWRNMKGDIRRYVQTCSTCQRVKAKYRSTSDQMSLPVQSHVPFHTVHVDFAELKKKSESNASTQSFLVVIDEATRIVYAKSMKQSGKALKEYFADHPILKNVKKIISDRGTSFTRREFYNWTQEKGIEFLHTSPYHPAGNGLAERVIQEIKTFMECYPQFPKGWKCCLEAAVHYHNRHHNTYLGCSPWYKWKGTVPVVPADEELGLQLHRIETENNDKQRHNYRLRTKYYYNRNRRRPADVKPGDSILVKPQYTGKQRLQTGPHVVTDVKMVDGCVKYVLYESERGTQSAHITNIIKFHHRPPGVPSREMVETRSGKMKDPAQERIKAEESAKPQLGATIGGDASSDPVVLNPNIGIPKYDGTEDPRPWIESLEEIGFLYHWADYIIARYAAMNMTGSAKTWLNLHKAKELRMKLNRMQHWNEPAIRFAEDILVLCNKVDPAMEEETKIDHVIGGLKKEYSFALYLNPPKTTDELLVACKKMDSFEKKYRERVEKSRNLYNGPRYSRPQQQSRYVPPTATRNYQTPSRPQAPVSNNYKNDFPPTPRQYRNNLTQPFTPRRPYNPNFVPKSNLQRNTYNKSQEVSKNRTEDGRQICFKCNKPGHVARYCRVKFIRILEEDPTATQEKIVEKCQMNEISDKSGPRLYADIGTFEALVDTGADLSVVDLRTALDTGHGISKLAKTCAGPDGKKLDIVGSILLNIKIDDKALSHKFVILKTHLRTLIFGRDFLKKMNAKIDCKKEIIKYDLTNNNDISNYELKKIKSVEDTVIPELSIRLIKASIEAEDGEYVIEENNRMIQTNGLRLARSLLTVTDTKTHIWITNPYPRPLKIMKDQTLAHGSLPAEVKFIEKLEQINNDEIQFQINKNLSPKEQEDLKQILIKYADLFSPRLGRTNLAKHRIDTEDAKPIKHKPYRVSPKERDIIKDQIDEMLKEGIIRPSSSPWSFPVILVKKRDGKFRFCVDYRKLNEVTVKDVYPIPRIDDVMDTLQGSKYFSAIDLRSGYWQVEIEEKDKEKTAFTTTHGLYEFNVMPFGLCNAPATFERNMDNVLGNLRWQICLCYLDDVIIYSSDFPTHLKRLEAVSKCFSESNLKLNDKKCRFAFEELEILGHITNQQGIKPAEYNIKAVRDLPHPKKVKEVQSFLGMCSYYRKFIKDFSLIADPLTGLIRKNAQFTWTEKQEEAFQNLKKALINPPILGHFDPNAATYIHTDASNYGLGATLVQIICGEEKVISYLSRTLSKAEQNYSTTEKECLAVVWAISKLRPYLYGRHFKIITDHHALCWLKNLKDPTGRLARWALKIQEYDFDIIHKSGKKHMDADGLSRGPLPETDWVEDYERLFLNQIINEEDEFIENVKKSLKGSKRAITQNFKEENGCLYKKNPNPEGRAWLLVVPKKRRKEIMSEFHNHMLNGHLGVARTTYRLKNKYHWPSMLKDVSEFVKTCHLCQSRKGSNQSPSGLLQPIPPANYPFERIGIDFVGPLPSTKRRRKWIIVLTDYYT
ncbi:hypothetical protein LAZ67_2003108, partial [Cordylochernes scorpioides]